MNVSVRVATLRKQRQNLINKNLEGILSDEYFKEQFPMIDEQLKRMEALENQKELENFNKQSAREFIQKYITNLEGAYNNCDIVQKRTLVSIYFPKGLYWNYPGLSKR